ncbi:ParB family protein [Glaesserella parasuis]|uniref:ParB family protein n=1 Tax=Glaesserella parasuis TaxID=738 RepID=UPI003CF8E566
MSSGKNPFANGKSKEERRLSMLQQLTQPAIHNTSPDYNTPTAHTVSGEHKKRLIVVTLDKLRPYEGNPRKTKNPAYEEIKASIKSRGLDHAPNVTQRPGDSFYTIADGGNTRLQALKELFTETQDPRFWSIECVFKPWEGEANDINSKLNMLIGHLAENDIRGELSFIEKALGIREVKALYEEKYKEYFSHRKLSEKLGENGYPISHQIIARMEQCLTYLYPHIPNILFTGFGKAQIDKLVSIHNKAESAWEKHKEEFPVNSDFSELWMNTLSPFDESPENFAISEFEDVLIGNISEAFAYQVTYEALKLEINLEERKLQRLLEKQPEIIQRATDSEHRIHEIQDKENHKETAETPVTSQKEAKDATPYSMSVSTISNEPESVDEVDHQFNIPNGDSSNLASISMPSIDTDNELSEAIAQHFAGYGLTPGVNPETQRAEEAIENGLEFANQGKQPVTNIWKIYPNRSHKMDAFSLALDIAEEYGIAHLIQHVVYEPVDYSFTVLPLDITEPNKTTVFIHSLLSILMTDNIDKRDVERLLTLSATALVGTLRDAPEISDLVLVRIFRLIRIVRYIKEQVRMGV